MQNNCALDICTKVVEEEGEYCSMHSETDCPVCYKPVGFNTLKCSHYLCKICSLKVRFCPICREDLYVPLNCDLDAMFIPLNINDNDIEIYQNLLEAINRPIPDIDRADFDRYFERI